MTRKEPCLTAADFWTVFWKTVKIFGEFF